jgi:hypothetical protein
MCTASDDSLTHVGQITMLRRLAGCPVRSENYFKNALVQITRSRAITRFFVASPVRRYDRLQAHHLLSRGSRAFTF